MQNFSIHRGLFSLLVFCCALLLGQSHSIARDIPQLQGRVNDHAAMLSNASISLLEKKLASLEATDSTQLVVLTINSLDGESIDGYAMQVAEAWKIGQEEFDNGALLVIAKNDKKLRIEVGYGLEGNLTDLISGRIIDGIITPAFKEGRFDQGIVEGVEAMIGTVKGEYNAASLPVKNTNTEQGDPSGIIGVLIFSFIFMKGMAKKNSAVAIAIGAIVTPIAGVLFGFTALTTILFLALFGGVAAFIASRMPKSVGGRRSSRRYRSIGRSRNTSYRGRSSGRFGGGGGGFGGGGASGGW